MMLLLRVTFIFNIAIVKPEVASTLAAHTLLTSFQLQRWVIGLHQLKRSANSDAVLQITFTLSMAALQFNMAAVKPEVVSTAVPEATLTLLQRE
jgi:cytochrome c oxidase assembly factor CtaG